MHKDRSARPRKSSSSATLYPPPRPPIAHAPAVTSATARSRSWRAPIFVHSSFPHCFMLRVSDLLLDLLLRLLQPHLKPLGLHVRRQLPDFFVARHRLAES